MENESLFKTYDFSVLNDPEFLEDSVREEIIVPILRKLGYSASAENKIIRSRSLTHPFVYIGSVSRKINIIPDYLLKTEKGSYWVLDAKSPNEEIERGKNCEQAFSYAIHPEVRAGIYALCNGRKLTVFGISEVNPILSIDVAEVDSRWNEVEGLLGPKFIDNPILGGFLPDFGLYLLKSGLLDFDSGMNFIGLRPALISKLNDSHYTLAANFPFFGEELVASFDFFTQEIEGFWEQVPEPRRIQIKKSLSNSPFRYSFNPEDEVELWFEAWLGVLTRNPNEDYLPLFIKRFLPK
jgi:hypothetical protein